MRRGSSLGARRSLPSSDEAIILGVSPDPEPKHAIFHIDGERSVVQADP